MCDVLCDVLDGVLHYFHILCDVMYRYDVICYLLLYHEAMCDFLRYVLCAVLDGAHDFLVLCDVIMWSVICYYIMKSCVMSYDTSFVLSSTAPCTTATPLLCYSLLPCHMLPAILLRCTS